MKCVGNIVGNMHYSVYTQAVYEMIIFNLSNN